MKKLIAFDLDGTLSRSKSQISDRMASQLAQLLDNFYVCVISGGKFEQFERQLLSNLRIEPDKLKKLHIMPTCGTRYYSYDTKQKNWHLNYAEDLKPNEKKKIIDALNKGVDDLGYREKKIYGDCIEDRESQITFSVLGQDIVDKLGDKGVDIKEAWDPDDSKKCALRDYVAPLIPEFEVRVGGITSVDVTKPGIDKGYGMKKLMGILDISKEDILFIGDRIREGGNDYPVKLMGIDCIEIDKWEETAIAITAINHVA